MPGVGIVINLGGYKINTISSTALINLGDSFVATPESEIKNKTAGAFSAGDLTVNNTPSAGIFNDPDIIDNTIFRPVSTS